MKKVIYSIVLIGIYFGISYLSLLIPVLKDFVFQPNVVIDFWIFILYSILFFPMILMMIMFALSLSIIFLLAIITCFIPNKKNEFIKK
jgi:hypothetical protein